MKTWIKTNLSKITLALTGAVSGVTSLIISSLAHDKTKCLCYFLDYEGNAHWEEGTIWEYKVSDKHKISLYFGFKPTSENDIKWDGTYSDGYFDN